MRKYFEIALAIVAALVISLSCFSVREDEYAAISKFGKIVKIIDEPGLNFKAPIVQSVRFISKKVNIYDIPPSGVITKDKKSMIVDSYILWRVRDPMKYVQTLGAEKNRASERIEAIVYNSIKNAISSMNQEEVIQARGETLAGTIANDAEKDTTGYGIEILQVQIKMLDLPADNKEAVYARMVSERKNIAAAYQAEGEAEAQKIKNTADKEIAIITANASRSADIIIAEGEVEFMKILQKAYDSPEKAEFYSYLRGLDALTKALANGENMVLLDKHSELAKLLYGK